MASNYNPPYEPLEPNDKELHILVMLCKYVLDAGPWDKLTPSERAKRHAEYEQRMDRLTQYKLGYLRRDQVL